jgi:hypothetical protein
MLRARAITLLRAPSCELGEIFPRAPKVMCLASSLCLVSRPSSPEGFS